MANDGFTTDDTNFAAALLYVFGQDALTRIEHYGYTGRKFFIDAPSLDCGETGYLHDYQTGQFNISDLKEYNRIQNWLIQRLKSMQKQGHTEWSSPSWVAGRG